MERLIASTVGKKYTEKTCAPSYFKSNSHSFKWTSLYRMKLPKRGTKMKRIKVDSWESKWPCYKKRNSLSIGLTSITALPSQPSKLPSISVTSRLKKRGQRGPQCRYRQGQRDHCLNHQRRRESFTFQSECRDTLLSLWGRIPLGKYVPPPA